MILERFRVDLGGPKEQDRYTECRVPLGCSGLLRAGLAVLVWSSLGFSMGERSARASAASETREAIWLFHMLQDCPSHREISNRKSILTKTFLISTRFPFPCQDRFMLGGFSSQNAAKTPPRRPQDAPRRPKTPPRRLQMRPRHPKTPPRAFKSAQDAPKTLPRRPKTPPRGP